jgi:peptidoglycan/LPS O-acetylase OafA/YrhL
MKHEFRINNFDLLRIFAATEVMLQHSFYHLNIPVPFWFTVFQNFEGVPMFFVISGYLISSSYERRSDLKNYFTNRFLRIYPGLWACILLTVITASIVGGINFFNAHAPIWFVSQLVGVIYTPQFLLHYGFGSYNGSLWTIPIELQFYIVLPVIYFFIAKFRKKNLDIFLLLLFFISLAYVIKISFPDMSGEHEAKMTKLIRYSFLPNFYMFLTGVALQRFKAYKSRIIYGKGLFWVVGFLLFAYFIPPFSAKFILSSLLLSVTTISLAYTFPGISKKLLRGNDISYGVYIYHGLLLNIIIELKGLNNMISLLVLYPTTYLIAFISWKFVEKPMLKKKKSTINTAEMPLN